MESSAKKVPDTPQATKFVSDGAGWVCRVSVKKRHKLTSTITLQWKIDWVDDPAQFEQPSHDLSFLPFCVVNCHQPPSAIP